MYDGLGILMDVYFDRQMAEGERGRISSKMIDSHSEYDFKEARRCHCCRQMIGYTITVTRTRPLYNKVRAAWTATVNICVMILSTRHGVSVPDPGPSPDSTTGEEIKPM